MDTNEILSQIDTEIARLQEVKNILLGTTTTVAKRAPGRPRVLPTPINSKRRKLSAEGRARIAAAQKVRWAKLRKAAKAA